MVLKITGLCLLLSVAAVAREYNPNEVELQKVPCIPANANERNNLIEHAKCGHAKEVFVSLPSKNALEQVSPRGVWLWRCAGACDFINEGVCTATLTLVKKIPVRIYNVATNKESCALYTVSEDQSCECVTTRRRAGQRSALSHGVSYANASRY